MRTSAVSGIIFANANDNMLKKITANRSIASVPYGSRYRFIDFALSNLVNAGVTRIGIITKENYRSLMDHVGNGVSWDLDRKNGGLYLLPPYITTGVKRYNGTIDALNGAMNFIERCASEYIVLCHSYTIANVNIAEALNAHIEKGADITVIYHNGSTPEKSADTMSLTLGSNERVTSIAFGHMDIETHYGIGYIIIRRDLLIKLVKEACSSELESFERDVLAKKLSTLKVYGCEHKEFVAVMDSTNSYYSASMALLKSNVRNQLFNKERPIYTKTRDDMPTRYGTKSKVSNSLVADGCVIDGTVKNSLLFRGVKVEKGAVVENCILMQETTVGKDTLLNNVISDKNAVINDGMVLKGTDNRHFYIKKNQVI